MLTSYCHLLGWTATLVAVGRACRSYGAPIYEIASSDSSKSTFSSCVCVRFLPTAAELGDAVRKTFTKGKFLFELLLDVAGENLVLFQAFDDFLVERRKFADLVLQNFFYIILSEFTEVVEANEPFAVQVGFFLFDEFEKRRSNQLRHHSAVR